jgi:hypothetical protein
MATKREPKQTEPNDVVVALNRRLEQRVRESIYRLKDPRVGLEGMPTPLRKYQVANVPLAVTCTIFLRTRTQLVPTETQAKKKTCLG